ncbi:MAG: CvpA family protein [Candidatus Omnitrophica bacterium]|nr:CvpA family protein [Candidatus Omnitrophota bacterium]
MLTHLIKSINWIDVVLLFLFIRMIFIGVKNGFLSEFFKFLGVVTAVFVSLHFYSYVAAWTAQKTHLSWGYWDLVVFACLWGLITLAFKFLRDGILLLFKVETTHEGFDKYAAGVVAVGRGLLVCSLTLFLILLIHNGPLTRMAVRSYSFKITGHAAVGTYSFLYNGLVDKLFPAGHYNAAAGRVLHPESRS